MKKLLSVILLGGLSTGAVQAYPAFCSPCVHVHHSSDDWAGPLAVGAIVGTGLGLVASAASRDHSMRHSSSLISDLQDQNDLLHAKIASLREKCAKLRSANEELRDENAELRHQIKKLKHSGNLMIKVDAGA